MPGGPVERLLAALADATPEAGGTGAASAAGAAGVRPIAIGWATVELDRAARELAADLAIEPDAFVPAAESVALGAWTRVARAVLSGGISVVILEPAREGPLAAILARRNEGPVAAWFETGEPGGPETLGGDAALAGGPFGPERRLTSGRLERFLVERGPGTIAP